MQSGMRDEVLTIEECPWSLRLFGEEPQFSLLVPQDRIDEAK